jgi:hypothetical protein
MDPSPSRRSSQLSSSQMSSSGPQPTRQPSLLPAFEPISSSPPRFNQQKRKFEDTFGATRQYPTPVPSSSTAILASSSPSRRPVLQRTASQCSERIPLLSVDTVRVPSSGEEILLGRSSASCHHQLPYNRLISRVHVSAKYFPRSASNASPQLVIGCIGWNGCKVHNGGRVYALAKNQQFVCREQDSEIILDVQDTRVILAWPGLEEGDGSEASWGGESSPDAPMRANQAAMFASSPPPMVPQSPISPSPARHISSNASALLYGDENVDPQAPVQVYEDPDSDYAQEQESRSPAASMRTTFHQSFIAKRAEDKVSQESFLSSVAEAFDEQDHENEENDPIIHSFGPFGSNILSRMNSVSARDEPSSPELRAKRRKVLKDNSESPNRPSKFPAEATKSPEKLSPYLHVSPIKNHVINQLAFSRVHAMPLSTIHGNLPADLKASNAAEATSEEVLTHAELKQIMDNIPCVGEIKRAGKDASGKPLEDEFYYVPDMDENSIRRDAVLGSRGAAGLRAVRKTHKVCSLLRYFRMTCLRALAILLEAPTSLRAFRSEISIPPIPLLSHHHHQKLIPKTIIITICTSQPIPITTFTFTFTAVQHPYAALAWRLAFHIRRSLLRSRPLTEVLSPSRRYLLPYPQSAVRVRNSISFNGKAYPYPFDDACVCGFCGDEPYSQRWLERRVLSEMMLEALSGGLSVGGSGLHCWLAYCTALGLNF